MKNPLHSMLAVLAVLGFWLGLIMLSGCQNDAQKAQAQVENREFCTVFCHSYPPGMGLRVGCRCGIDGKPLAPGATASPIGWL